MTCACQAKAYEGRADHVWPPFSLGWAEVPYAHDEGVRSKARMMLGSLPVYHYADEALEGGLYRFFKYETPIGEAVGALKFIGEGPARMLLGQGGATVADWVDSNAVVGGLVQLESGGALPEDNSAVTGDGTGNAGVKVTAASYPSVGAAAVAMNNALLAHGYRRADQAIYAGFQLSDGHLTVDAFPGTNTMNELRTQLASLSPPVTMASVPIYPWLATTSSGATGAAAYDGVNAPSWAQWTGAGTGPSTPASTASASSGSGALLATLATAAVVVGGVIAKSAGAF